MSNGNGSGAKRGVDDSLFDKRAMLVAAGIAALMVLGAIALKMKNAAETARATEVHEYEFRIAEPTVEEFKLKEPPRDFYKERVVESMPSVAIAEEKPNIHMTRVASDTPVQTEVIQSSNTSVETQTIDIKMDDKTEISPDTTVTVADRPEEVSVISETVSHALQPIAVTVDGPADIFKYKGPAPRDKPALYTFTSAPSAGRSIKVMAKAFGDQTAPSYGEIGPANINLNGTGEFFRVMDRAGGVKARSAVDGALHWLAVHQGPDGMWEADKLDGEKQGSLAVTALANLALMGGGNTTRKGEYSRVVLKGIEAILRHQAPDGHISDRGTNLYTHAICTIALCESFGRARDERVGAAAQKAIDYCMSAVNADGGWRYAPKAAASDVSVTAWFIQSMKTAKLSQIKFDHGIFSRAITYLDSCTDQAGSRDSNGGVSYMAKGERGNDSAANPALTAAGMMIRQFNGMGVKSSLLIKAADLTKSHPPTWKRKNFYEWYYATYAMHNMGGEYRIWWNQRIRDVLLANQSKDGDNAGSWDPKGDTWAGTGGRTYTTALGALCLEVYYRYSDSLTAFGTAPDLDELFEK